MARFINFSNRFLLVFSLCDPSLSPSVARGINAPLECYRDKADLCDGQEGMLAPLPFKLCLDKCGKQLFGREEFSSDMTSSVSSMLLFLNDYDTETLTEGNLRQTAECKSQDAGATMLQTVSLDLLVGYP